MQWVGDLVGLHSDQIRRLDQIDRCVEVLRPLLRREGAGEGLRELRQEVLRKGPAEAHHALPEQRLAFVHGHAGGCAHRQALVLHTATLLVERVPGLVDGPGQALHHVLGLEPGGHADVRGMGPAGERMHANVQAALAQVEAQGQRNLPAELRLPGGVEVALEPRGVRRRAPLAQIRQEGHQALLDLVEDLLDPCRREAS
mmetsp:Transcript_35428/g.101835  ORF Transcript_35428/g.101835 Transcript_35428/m.101835 type:complete len:200 (+) Transcript_35428:497-1096(+)